MVQVALYCHGCVIQFFPRNMHTVFALLCFVVVIHWPIFPYPSVLLHWHCGNLTIAPVPAKQPWWIWINNSCEFIMNDCITTTKQSTTKPCAYFLGYTVLIMQDSLCSSNVLFVPSHNGNTVVFNFIFLLAYSFTYIFCGFPCLKRYTTVYILHPYSLSVMSIYKNISLGICHIISKQWLRLIIAIPMVIYRWTLGAH